MTKYALIFKSNAAFDWTTLPPEDAEKAAAAWGNWIASMGSAVRASDAFKFGGRSVSEKGTTAADNLLIGYVLIEVENFDEAEKLAEGAPSVATGQGSIEVYEILPTTH